MNYQQFSFFGFAAFFNEIMINSRSDANAAFIFAIPNGRRQDRSRRMNAPNAFPNCKPK